MENFYESEELEVEPDEPDDDAEELEAIELYNGIKNTIKNMYYEGCFLHELTLGDFIDFLQNENKAGGDGNGKQDKFILDHIDIYDRIKGWFVDVCTEKELKLFVYKYSYTRCKCKLLNQNANF